MSRVVVQISGKHIDRLLLRLNKQKVNLLKVLKKDEDIILIIINYIDLDTVLKWKHLYNIEVKHYLGWLHIKQIIYKNRFIIFFIIIFLSILYFLSNLIFNITIITNDEQMKEMLLKELSNYNISKYHLKKSYDELAKIKEQIKQKYNNKIEWIEIESVGTKYIIRYEPRIVLEEKPKTENRNIIAKKNAIILKIDSSKGQIIRNINDYVKKGDIIISGNIALNNNIKDTISAEGTVYGEVWYELSVDYPFGYFEQTKTGKKKTVYSVKFFNKRVDLFNLKKFHDKIETEQILLHHDFLPIKFSRYNQEEVNTTSAIHTVEEASFQAVLKAQNKLLEQLNDDEFIMNYRILSSTVTETGVELKIFFSVCENITEYQIIENVGD